MIKKSISSPTSRTIILAFILMIAVNLCALKLSRRIGLRFDMTGTQLYTLSETSIELLKSLDTPIHIRVFSDEKDFLPLVKEILSRYQMETENLVVSYTDPYENPTIVDEYIQRGLEIYLGTIVVEGRYRARAIQLEEMFELDSSGEKVQNLTCEQQITGSILFVNVNKSPLVQFTVGHSEHVSEKLVSFFTDSNYTCKNITLSIDELDTNCELLVIASPLHDFSSEETGKLDRYLAKGGRLLVFVEPSSALLPNLKEFLAEWGIGLTDIVVAEKAQYTDTNPLSIVPIYANHEINQYFASNQMYCVMPATRALEQLFVSQNGVQTQKLLYSTDRAYDSTGENTKSGPYALAITSEKKRDDNCARLVIIGSRGIYSESLMSTDQYANSRFLAQVVNWCSSSKDSVSIPPKDLTSSHIRITIKQTIWLAIILLMVFPASLISIGLYIYRHRHHS